MRPTDELFFVLRKCDSCSRVFLVNPQEDCVEFVPLLGRARGSSRSQLFASPHGFCFLPSRHRICCIQALEQTSECNEHFIELFEDKDVGLSSTVLEHEGSIYVPGSTWIRIDPETWSVEALGSDPWLEGWDDWRRFYGVSVHYGLLAWKSTGRFYVVSVDADVQDAKLERSTDSEVASNKDHKATNSGSVETDAEEALGVETLSSHIEEGQQLGLAVLCFNHDCGLWPQYLNDMVPRYIESVPAGWEYSWNVDSYVYIHRECKSIGEHRNEECESLAYVFGGYERGWYIRQGGKYKRFNVQSCERSVLPLTRAEVVHNGLRELDRRIAREPQCLDHLRMKTWYLMSVGRLGNARRSAVLWAKSDPSSSEARCAISEIERQRLEDCSYPRDELNKANGACYSYAAWRVANVPSGNTGQWGNFRIALEIPFARDTGEFMIAEHEAYWDAGWLLNANRLGTLIRFCDRWEGAASVQDGFTVDLSYMVYRAAAYLRRGQYEKAQHELDLLDAAASTGCVRCDCSRLREAISKKNNHIDFKCKERVTCTEWDVRFNITLPPDD